MPNYHVEEITDARHVADVVLLGSRLHQEKGTGDYDQEHAMRFAIRIAMMQDRLFDNAWIVYHGEQPIGFFLAHANYAFAHKELYAYHDLWYVIPEKRGGRAAALLWRTFENWAMSIEASQLHATVSLAVGDMRKVVAAIRKRGLRISDYTYTKMLDRRPQEEMRAEPYAVTVH